MIIEDILQNNSKILNTTAYQVVNELNFELHNVIVNGIIPFPYKFYYAKTFIIVRKQ